jgi:hypothetical protein
MTPSTGNFVRGIWYSYFRFTPQVSLSVADTAILGSTPPSPTVTNAPVLLDNDPEVDGSDFEPQPRK